MQVLYGTGNGAVSISETRGTIVFPGIGSGLWSDPMRDHYQGGYKMITIKTNFGDISIELFEKEAPITTANFLEYVRSGFYKDTLFHRVISGFMIQGGGMNRDFVQKKGNAPIKNEATNQISNKRGTIAMARTGVVDSATSQFFINLVDNDFLDFKAPTPQYFGYCVFGKVVAGMEVVDKIAGVETGNRGMHRDVPVNEVVILDAVEE